VIGDDYTDKHFWDDASKVTRWSIAAGLLAVLVVGSIWVAGIFGFGWLSNETADFRGKVAQHNQIEANGAYRIAAYDTFYNECASVQTAQAAITNTEIALKATTDPARKVQLQANLLALKNTLAQAVAQYNVDARKAGTLGQFRASDLPFTIDQTEEITCTAK
jgi:hypothetical protein